MSDRTPRRDALIGYFNVKGYQPILVPRGGLVPPDIYVLTEGSYDRLRDLETVLSNPARFSASLAQPAAGFSELQARSSDAKVGVSFFKALIERFGIAAAPELKAKANFTKDSAFSFDEVEVRSVEPGEIEDALAAGFRLDAIGHDRIAAGSVHIAYEYLYARKINIVLGDGSGGGASFGAQVEQVLTIDLEASRTKKLGDSIVYKSESNPIAIAFKAAKLHQVHGSWRLELRQSSDPDSKYRKGREYVFTTGAVLDIHEAKYS